MWHPCNVINVHTHGVLRQPTNVELCHCEMTNPKHQRNKRVANLPTSLKPRLLCLLIITWCLYVICTIWFMTGLCVWPILYQDICKCKAVGTYQECPNVMMWISLQEPVLLPYLLIRGEMIRYCHNTICIPIQVSRYDYDTIRYIWYMQFINIFRFSNSNLRKIEYII